MFVKEYWHKVETLKHFKIGLIHLEVSPNNKPNKVTTFFTNDNEYPKYYKSPKI